MSVLQRYRWVVLAVLGVGLIAGAIWSETSRRRDVASTPGPGSTTTTTTDGGQVQTAGQLGPTPGPDSEGYIAEKRQYLEAIATQNPDAPAASLISLAALRTGDEVRQLVRGARLDFLFVRFPRGATEVLQVEGTVEVTMGSAITRRVNALETEIAQLEELAKTTPPADRQRHLQEAADRRAAATRIKSECRCIYAVVTGPLPLRGLATLQSGQDVRLVDVPNPVASDLRGWELTPILPKS